MESIENYGLFFLACVLIHFGARTLTVYVKVCLASVVLKLLAIVVITLLPALGYRQTGRPQSHSKSLCSLLFVLCSCRVN